MAVAPTSIFCCLSQASASWFGCQPPQSGAQRSQTMPLPASCPDPRNPCAGHMSACPALSPGALSLRDSGLCLPPKAKGYHGWELGRQLSGRAKTRSLLPGPPQLPRELPVISEPWLYVTVWMMQPCLSIPSHLHLGVHSLGQKNCVRLRRSHHLQRFPPQVALLMA